MKVASGPEDMDVDPHREHAFRRGYISRIYDALLGVQNRLKPHEFALLETWITDRLSAWSTSDLEKAIRPPTPSDPTLSHVIRKHGDGPFILD